MTKSVYGGKKRGKKVLEVLKLGVLLSLQKPNLLDQADRPAISTW